MENSLQLQYNPPRAAKTTFMVMYGIFNFIRCAIFDKDSKRGSL